MTGTLRAFRGQHVSSDVLSAVGHQDITAHVDFDALERAARVGRFDVVERRRQAEFLIDNGLDEAYAAARVERRPGLECRAQPALGGAPA